MRQIARDELEMRRCLENLNDFVGRHRVRAAGTDVPSVRCSLTAA